MKPRLHLLAALALVVPAAAHAQSPADGTAPAPSAFTLPVADLGESGGSGDFEHRWSPGGDDGTSFRYIRYRPRYYRSRSNYWMPFVTQLHAGFFDPSGNPSSGFLFGFRGGPMVDPHVQLGLSVDWEHKSSSFEEQFQAGEVGGVGTVTPTTTNEGTTTNFVPILGFLQIGGDESMPVIPYAGIGGGYEILTVDNSGASFNGASIDGTYGGWGWQGWAGAAVPLSGQARIFGEGFYNWATVSQDVDTIDGPIRFKISRDGFGARFGLSWGF